MKNKKLFILLSLLALSSCEAATGLSSLPTVTEENKIVFTDTYALDATFDKNTNTLTGDLKQDTINYFLTFGSHFSAGTDYIFIYKQNTNGVDFKVNLTYDSSLETNPFYFACTCFLDDTKSLPDAYYFFSAQFNITDYKNLDFTSYYCYDYEDDDTAKSGSVGITYTNLDYGTCPMINSASFKRNIGTEMPSRAIKEDKELGASAFEEIRFGTSYLEMLLQAVSTNYHIW